MRTKVEFQSVEPQTLRLWRQRYLQGLEKAQALLLELMVPQASALSINRKGERIGYALIAKDETLVEYYLEPRTWLYSDDIARQLVQQQGVKRAIVKSFDALMLSSLMEHQSGTSVMGYLARDYSPLPLPQDLAPRMEGRLATQDDLAALCAIRQDVFLDKSRFASAVEGKEVIGYFDGDTMLGFGMLRPVCEGQEALEINLAVDPDYRRRAYAAYILQDLLQRCVAQGLQPIASCPKDNQASRILGERLGLSSRDRLLALSFEA